MVAYVAVLTLGIITLPSADHPIGEPYFTVMELLILLMVPPIILMMIAIASCARPRQKALGVASVTFMAMAGCTTSAVHFAILVLSRHPTFSEMPRFLAFEWPSVVYVVDILAWDIFFALSVLFAAPIFRGNGLAAWIRMLLIASGLLAFAGLAGVVTGDMQIRNIGILGYAGIFPIAALLIALFFYRQPDDCPDTTHMPAAPQPPLP